ncbi:MAG: GNAT family N-acetyltransferase [Oscillospiraceae bacterium]
MNGICLETERLKIAALTPGQLELLSSNIPALEKELGCSYRAEPMEGVLKEIVVGQVRRAQEDSENYFWHSFWLIIRKSDNTAVGSADFKSPPDINGEVEIGYGLGKEFEHQGYMTETVRAMCDWALSQKGVAHVIAETELWNTASQRILQRCGFVEYERKETLWWRL